MNEWSDLKRPSKKVRKIITSSIKESFDDVVFDRIVITPELDSQDKRMLVIRAVYDSDPKSIYSRRWFDLVHSLIEKLVRAGEDAFPLLCFISKTDLEKSGHELERFY